LKVEHKFTIYLELYPICEVLVALPLDLQISLHREFYFK